MEECPVLGLSHITFAVSDLQRSVDFYVGALGAKVLLRSERMAYLDAGGVWLALNLQVGKTKIDETSYTHVAFHVSESLLEASSQRLANLGVKSDPGRIREAGEGRSIYFRDPDGHLLEFHTGSLLERLKSYK